MLIIPTRLTGLVNAPTYALVIAVPVCIVLNYLLVLGP